MYEYTTQTHLTDARVSKRQAWLDSHHRDNTYIKSLWLPSSCPLQNSYYDQSVGGQSLFNGRFRDTKIFHQRKKAKWPILTIVGFIPMSYFRGLTAPVSSLSWKTKHSGRRRRLTRTTTTSVVGSQISRAAKFEASLTRTKRIFATQGSYNYIYVQFIKTCHFLFAFNHFITL